MQLNWGPFYTHPVHSTLGSDQDVLNLYIELSYQVKSIKKNVMRKIWKLKLKS